MSSEVIVVQGYLLTGGIDRNGNVYSPRLIADLVEQLNNFDVLTRCKFEHDKGTNSVVVSVEIPVTTPQSKVTTIAENPEE